MQYICFETFTKKLEALILLFIETLVVAFMIIIMHSSIKKYGIGPLFIFLGSLQFFQTILIGSVYNLYFNSYVFSPGSSVLFTSTLFCVLLVFHTESMKKTRSLIYGLIFSNIAISLLSYISLEQIYMDNQSVNLNYLKNILDFELDIFVTGTSLFYIDLILLIVIYEFFNYKFPKKYIYLKLLLTTTITSLFDSVIFYTFIFYSDANYSDILIGNIIGKQIVILFLSFIFFIYLSVVNKCNRKPIPKNTREIFKIFSF